MKEIKVVLFDLDGTLLPVNTEEFLTYYLKMISVKVANHMEPEKFVRVLMSATDAMINDLSDRTNEEVFMESFLPHFEGRSEELLEEIEQFYEQEFPKLRQFTKDSDLSREVVERVIESGRDVVIATNPVFPMRAIKERLKWVNVDKLPVKYITSYENMSYCKPQLEYYKQIADKIKINPVNCLMVGNDAQEDLIAREIGMKTYLVEDYLIDRSEGNYKTDYQGTLTQLSKFLQEKL
ncbi:FMN phosphatase YigB (HAD superfamily) [Desulfitispora alkaliphila]|uniref:HAD family hydrolase n=1 Tax=Desulfitispora alkaliphila TaxID=622674 RepID=UPI003D232153